MKLNASAQQAFDQGKFKKAQSVWARTIQGLEDNGQKDTFLESCLKRIGQTYLKLERTVEAYQALVRAREMCAALQIDDKELTKELDQLGKIYRSVDPKDLGDRTAAAFEKANVTNVSLIKTDAANKMQIDLSEKFEKPLSDESVDILAFDKHVTLDVTEAEDGTVILSNIKGLKVHAKEMNLWVNLLQATIKPVDEHGDYPADVIAGKMGVTKTVTATLPHRGFEPLAGMLKQLKEMSPAAVSVPQSDNPAAEDAAASSSPTADASPPR